MTPQELEKLLEPALRKRREAVQSLRRNLFLSDEQLCASRAAAPHISDLVFARVMHRVACRTIVTMLHTVVMKSRRLPDGTPDGRAMEIALEVVLEAINPDNCDD
jgi:hypothetical protein